MANFSSRLRERKGRREMIGRIMSETSELAQEVKAAARLGFVSTATGPCRAMARDEFIVH
jgi:hypothetical protein